MLLNLFSYTITIEKSKSDEAAILRELELTQREKQLEKTKDKLLIDTYQYLR